MFVLITGGSCSGKSAYAEERIRAFRAEMNIYLATMQVYDEESKARVIRHRKMRAGKDFHTVERPFDLPECFSEIGDLTEGGKKKSALLLECLSNLAANEMFRGTEIIPAETVTEKITREVLSLMDMVDDLVIVTNNIFEDGGSYDETTLSYMRALGETGAALAKEADEVFEVVCGIPVRMK